MKRPEGFDRRAPVEEKPRNKPPTDRSPADAQKTGDPASEPDRTGQSWILNQRTTRLVAGFRDAVWPDRSSIQSTDIRPTRPSESIEPRDKAAERTARSAARKRRRYEKGEVRRFTRRSRRRKVIWLVALGTTVTMGVLVAIAVYSPLLELKTIRIDGASRISPDDIQAAVDGQLGTPLALVDFAALEDELSGFPLIRSYVTETVPPDTLVIHVVERTPIGSIATPSGFSLVDPAGIVIEKTSERIAGVPVIEAGESATSGDVPDSEAFDAAVEVLVALPVSVVSRLDTITAVTRDDVRLTLVDTGASIVWGSADDSEIKGRALNALLANVPQASEFNVSAPGQATYQP